jgi:hypothetical protein
VIFAVSFMSPYNSVGNSEVFIPQFFTRPIARNLRVERVIDKIPVQHFFGVSCPQERNSDERHFGDLTALYSTVKRAKDR